MTPQPHAPEAQPVQRGRWPARLGVLALTVLGLSACAGLKWPAPPSNDLRTVSDQSETERRARVRLELASAYFSRGQLETALDELKQAIALYPNMGDAYNLRGLIYGSLSEPALAEESFDKALRLTPNDGGIWHNQGWFYCQQNRYGDAERSFVRALALPQYRELSKTLLAKGVCEAKSGQLNLASYTLQGAVDREPSNPVLAVNLADVLYKMGQFERAAQHIRRVNEQPAWVNAQTLWLGARVERKLGQIGSAQALEQVLKLRHPQSPEAQAMAQGLRD